MYWPTASRPMRRHLYMSRLTKLPCQDLDKALAHHQCVAAERAAAPSIWYRPCQTRPGSACVASTSSFPAETSLALYLSGVYSRRFRMVLHLTTCDPISAGTHAHDSGPQQVSSSLWALAKLGHTPSADRLLSALCCCLSAGLLLHALPQHVSNIIWALGTLGAAVCRLF